MIWALIKNGKVENTIIADQDFIDRISSQWDQCIRIDEMERMPGVGWDHDGSSFVFPIQTLTLESEVSTGGSATESMLVATLLSTDVLQSIAIKTQGANPVNIVSQGEPQIGAIEVTFDGDPGAGLVIELVVERQA